MKLTKELKQIVEKKYMLKVEENNKKEFVKNKGKFKKELDMYNKLEKKYDDLYKKQRETYKEMEHLRTILKTKHNVDIYKGYGDKKTKIQLHNIIYELKKPLNEIIVELQYTNNKDILKQIDTIFKSL